MNSAKLQNKFSQAAGHYDRYAILQKKTGDRLLNKIKNSDIAPRYILDIGTGTARLTAAISSIYKNASVFGIDFSWGMLEYARGRTGSAKLMQADARELPFKNNSFDLIISNLTFQWIQDISSLFRDISPILRKQGRFYFTTFGPNTLRELKAAFPASRETMASPSIDELKDNLRTTGFKILDEAVNLEKKLYPNMVSLVSWLKNIGANYVGNIPSKSLGIRNIWQDAESVYNESFRDNGNIFATFEIITISTEK